MKFSFSPDLFEPEYLQVTTELNTVGRVKLTGTGWTAYSCTGKSAGGFADQYTAGLWLLTQQKQTNMDLFT